ncbi:MAG: class I SAM-dependent methyltransferase [Candidatus Natronoplasma sp.]
MENRKKKVSDRYDNWTPFYDLVDGLPLISRPQRKWKKRAVEYLDASSGERTLDVGTGTAQIIPLIAEEMEEGELIGSDISSSMIEYARDRVNGLNGGVDVKVIHDDIENSKFPSDYFDKIISTFTFTTIPNVEKAAEECARILDPDGHMIVLDTGSSDKLYAAPLFYPMMISAKVFGRTHIDRAIKEVLNEYFQVEILEKNLLGMVYTLKCEI